MYDRDDQKITIVSRLKTRLSRHKPGESSDQPVAEVRDLYPNLFDELPCPVWRSGVDGKRNYFNRAWLELTGRSAERENGDGWTRGVHPHDRDRCLQTCLDAFNTRQTFEIHYRLRRHDAEYRCIIDLGSPLSDPAGSFAGYVGTCFDVTDQHSEGNSAKRQHEILQTIFDRIPIMISLVDQDLNFQLVNREWEQRLGWTLKEMTAFGADVVSEMYPDPEERKRVKAFIGNPTGEWANFRTRTRDGQILDTAWARVQLSDGSSIGIGQDITERKRADESLKLFRSLLDRSIDAIEVIEPDTLRFLDCNQSAFESLGYTREEFLALSVFDIDPKVDESRAAKVVAEMKRSGFAMFESVHRRKDGSTFPVEVNVKEIQLERAYRLAIVRDITERKRAEGELQESEVRFRQLSEAALEAIIIHDQRTILEVNQPFCRMYGYERAEVLGQSVLDLALPEFRSQLLQIVQSGDPSPYTSPALRKDGTVFSAEVAGKPINYRGRVARVAAIRDITAKRRNERRQAAQHGVTRVLAESATLADAIPNLLRAICESLRWKMGEFWRVCDGTNHLRCVETWHVPSLDANAFIEASRQTELTPDSGMPGRVWQGCQPAWIPDVMTDPGFARADMVRSLGLRGAVAFPIPLGDHTLGVMLFFSRRTPEVDEDLLTMMSALGSQIGQFTERKHAEDALREAEHNYRDIFENADEGIFQSTPSGRFVSANPALARMHGFASPEELIRARNDISKQAYVDPARRDEFKRLLEQVGVVRGFEHELFRNDGTKLWISVNARAVRNGSGDVLYYEGTAQDITQRKLAEAEQRRSEERYRELFENSKDPIYVHDLEGNYTSVNRAAEELSGYTRDEIMGKNYKDFVPLDERARIGANLRRKLADAGETVYEIEMIARDGRRVPLEIHSRLIFENGVPVAVQGTALDITERRQARDAMQTYARRLIEAHEEERHSIARELHDEIGQLLTAMRLNLHSMKAVTEKQSVAAQASETIHMIDQAMDQVRDLSLSLRPALLDDLGLAAALRWYVDRYEQRTGIRTGLATGDLEKHGRLNRDLETACFRIVQEALTNAARHAQPEMVSVSFIRSTGALDLTIKDDGVGFDPRILLSRDGGGSTLGLRGMDERAEGLNGKLTIQSAQSKGTEIRVSFPLPSTSTEGVLKQ